MNTSYCIDVMYMRCVFNSLTIPKKDVEQTIAFFGRKHGTESRRAITSELRCPKHVLIKIIATIKVSETWRAQVSKWSLDSLAPKENRTCQIRPEKYLGSPDQVHWRTWLGLPTSVGASTAASPSQRPQQREWAQVLPMAVFSTRAKWNDMGLAQGSGFNQKW